MTAGYGSDIWCTNSLSPGRTARDANVVAQALFRRFITPRGTLRGGAEERAYGLDLAEYVGSVGTETAVAAIPSVVRGEALKDDRVRDVAVVASQTQDAAGLTLLRLEIVALLASSDDSFTLTVTVSDVGVALIGVTT